MGKIFDQLENEKRGNLASCFVHPSYILECELDSAMSECNREKSRELLATINSLKRAVLSDNPLESLRYSVICSCTCYTRTAIRAGVDPERAFNLSDLYIRQVGIAAGAKRIIELEEDMMLDFIQLIEQDKQLKNSGNAAVNRIIHYINANITRRITLEELAAEVHMHPIYVSSLFPAETGQTVSAYINAQKVEAIKGFLRETDMQMAEIADIMGFASAAHFSYFFKKQTGMTPKQCRMAEKHQI